MLQDGLGSVSEVLSNCQKSLQSFDEQLRDEWQGVAAADATDSKRRKAEGEVNNGEGM